MEKEEVFYQRTASPEPSCVSMKSDMSMAEPLVFSAEVIPFSFTSSDENKPSDITQQFHKTASTEPSCVSMKSDMSMAEPLVFSTEVIPSSHRCSGASERIMRGSSSVDSAHCYTEAALQTHSLLEVTGDLQQDSQQPVNDVLQRVKDAYKTSMKNRYERLFEGIKVQENQTLLNRIYTQLYIIDGEGEEVNEEHEVLQMEKTPRTQQIPDTPINCNEIFKPSLEPGYDQQKQQKKKIKTVLTKGIAGIGKTVSVQKFIVDWAEGKANQDVEFMFVLPFRELNLIKDDQYSLHRLLLDFHPELQDLDLKIYNKCKVVFILDGLDESRITLMFSDSKKVSNVTETSSVGVLMSNLIKGELLPSALIWITSRPAAANQIPYKYINRVVMLTVETLVVCKWKSVCGVLCLLHRGTRTFCRLVENLIRF